MRSLNRVMLEDLNRQIEKQPLGDSVVAVVQVVVLVATSLTKESIRDSILVIVES